VNIDIS